MNTKGLFDTNTEMGAFLDDAINGPEATNEHNIYVRTFKDLDPATLIKENPKSFRVRNAYGEEYRVPKDRCVWPDEVVAVVWEQYRGIEGTHRIEKELYPEWRVPAHKINTRTSHQGTQKGFVVESDYGVISTIHPIGGVLVV